MKRIGHLLLAVMFFSFLALDAGAGNNGKNKGKAKKDKTVKVDSSPVLKGIILEKEDPVSKSKAYYLQTSEYGEILLPDPKTLNPDTLISTDDYKRFLNQNVIFISQFEKDEDSKSILIKKITNIKLSSK